MPEAAELADLLEERFGIALEGRTRTDDGEQVLELRPRGVERTIGFSLHARIGWRSVRVWFSPDPYAVELVHAMGQAEAGAAQAFAGSAHELMRRRARIELSVNGHAVDPTNPAAWPQTWTDVSLAMVKLPSGVAESSPDGQHSGVADWVGAMLGMVMHLLPVSEVRMEDAESEGVPEGARLLVSVNRYERSRANRGLCISVHGSRCAACGMSFADKYGPMGEGFIHVHHVTPLSEMGGSYVVNPVRDLIPVCPNCHAMLHRRTPPFTVQELRARLVHVDDGTAPVAAE